MSCVRGQASDKILEMSVRGKKISFKKLNDKVSSERHTSEYMKTEDKARGGEAAE